MSSELPMENLDTLKAGKHGVRKVLRKVFGYMIILFGISWILLLIAVPRPPSHRLRANESAAIATLRNVISAQSQIKSSAVIDLDRDGIGEYGYFAELVGTLPLRTTKDKLPVTLTPAVLSHALGIVDEHGLVKKSGYFFRMFIANDRCLPRAEAAFGGDGGAARRWKTQDPAETYWACYAWPVEPVGIGGHRAFMANQSGEVLQTNNMVHGYHGTSCIPNALAAYSVDGEGDMSDPLSIQGQPGPAKDGGEWWVVN